MAIIELKNICKNYQMDKVTVKAVDDASFAIEKGEVVAITGPSGSGKSTLLNMIGMIDLPTSGKLIINDNDIYGDIELSSLSVLPDDLDKKLTDLRRNLIGFIFQTFNLIPVLNVYDNIKLPLTVGASEVTKNSAPEQIEEWLNYLIDTVGLTDWKNHKPSELSGGQRQRVAIARALVTKAPIILADEPTANLDSKNGTQILELIQKLNKELNTTVVFSTHDAKIVKIADRAIKIKDGRI